MLPIKSANLFFAHFRIDDRRRHRLAAAPPLPPPLPSLHLHPAAEAGYGDGRLHGAVVAGENLLAGIAIFDIYD